MENNTKNLVTLQHGSHLYGLARPDSDIDLYTVYDFLHRNYRPKKQAEQQIEGETDSFKISYDKFCEQVRNGVPQALEVLFADPKFNLVEDPSWGADIYEGHRKHIFRNNYNKEITLETYRRTIINFFKVDDFKKNRHGFRLLLNADHMKRVGPFDPTLTSYQIGIINDLANKPWSARIEKYKDMLWDIYG